MNIIGYNLEKTCDACPEQYDVFLDGEQAGYLRLRHGVFSVKFPDCGGIMLWQTDRPSGDGIFDENEREYFLETAVKLIDNHIEEMYK